MKNDLIPCGLEQLIQFVEASASHAQRDASLIELCRRPSFEQVKIALLGSRYAVRVTIR